MRSHRPRKTLKPRQLPPVNRHHHHHPIRPVPNLHQAVLHNLLHQTAAHSLLKIAAPVAQSLLLKIATPVAQSLLLKIAAVSSLLQKMVAHRLLVVLSNLRKMMAPSLQMVSSLKIRILLLKTKNLLKTHCLKSRNRIIQKIKIRILRRTRRMTSRSK